MSNKRTVSENQSDRSSIYPTKTKQTEYSHAWNQSANQNSSISDRLNFSKLNYSIIRCQRGEMKENRSSLTAALIGLIVALRWHCHSNDRNAKLQAELLRNISWCHMSLPLWIVMRIILCHRLITKSFLYLSQRILGQTKSCEGGKSVLLVQSSFLRVSEFCIPMSFL